MRFSPNVLEELGTPRTACAMGHLAPVGAAWRILQGRHKYTLVLPLAGEVEGGTGAMSGCCEIFGSERRKSRSTCLLDCRTLNAERTTDNTDDNS